MRLLRLLRLFFETHPGGYTAHLGLQIAILSLIIFYMAV